MKGKRMMLLVAGIVTFVMAGLLPLLKSDVAVAKAPEERCGICVTPEGNWPYPDPASDLFASGCRPC